MKRGRRLFLSLAVVLLLFGLLLCGQAWAEEGWSSDGAGSGETAAEAGNSEGASQDATSSVDGAAEAEPLLNTPSDPEDAVSEETTPTGEAETEAGNSEGASQDATSSVDGAAEAEPLLNTPSDPEDAVSEETTPTGEAETEVQTAASAAPAGQGGVVDPIIGVKVNYEYPSDADLINPCIEVTDPSGNKVSFDKAYNPAHQAYEVRFDYPMDPEKPFFEVSVSAPGYTALSKTVLVSRHPTDPNDPNYYGHVVFELQATPSYRLGREVTRRADELLGFDAADGVLCITTAGGVHYQGSSSEDALEGILNQAYGLITFGQGNLLTLRKTRFDPIDFAFVVKQGDDLRLAYFKNGNLEPIYVGTISQNMTDSQWTAVVNKLGGEAFPVASLANAWAEGLSSDILRAAAFHGHVCVGTISGYAMIETLLKQYPPGGPGTGIEATSYRVIGVPGGSDDDVFLWAMDATPGKRAYVGRDSTDDPNMVGFIRWNDRTKTGTLIVMRFDEQALAAQFKAETGITVKEDTLCELRFNAWLVQKLKTLPETLVTIVVVLDNLTQEQCNYLTGGMGSTTVEDARGLDMDYIEWLKSQENVREAVPANITLPTGNLTPEQIKQIGNQAAQKAIELFLEELGLRLEKDDPNLLALTSAGYVRLNGQATCLAWDGIYEVLGSRLSRKTLLPVHSALWGELWFSFALKQGDELHAVHMRYDPASAALVASRDSAGNAVHDIGPKTLNDSAKLSIVRRVFGGQFSSVQTIANAMRHDPPYEMLLAYLFHNHVCPGISPSYLIADHIYENYPLGEDERYIYVTTVNYCKEDALIYLLGVSPGTGSYYNLRLKEGDDTKSQIIPGGNLEGILIRWNDKLQVGQAVIISYAWPTWDTQGLNTTEARREAQIAAFIRAYKGIEDPRIVAAPQVATETSKWITREELATILSWAPDPDKGNVLQFVMGLPDRSLADLLPPPVVPEPMPGVPISRGESGRSTPSVLTPAPAIAAPPDEPAPETPTELPDSGEPQSSQLENPRLPAQASPGESPVRAAAKLRAAPAGPTPGPEPGALALNAPPAEPAADPAPASAGGEVPAVQAFEVVKEPAVVGRSPVILFAAVGALVLVTLGVLGSILVLRRGA